MVYSTPDAPQTIKCNPIKAEWKGEAINSSILTIILVQIRLAA